MGTNFDYLLSKPEYVGFAEQAVEAEKSIAISPATCAILTRRALELAVRFVFTYDAELQLPYQDNISSLIHETSFRNIIEPQLFPMLKYMIHLGNVAVHTNSKIKRDDAVVALRDLFEFCDWIDYCYSKEYEPKAFDESLLPSGDEKRVKADELRRLYEALSSKDKKLEEMMKENESLRQKMASERKTNTHAREFCVDKLSEAETRERYIDVSLREAGWIIGKNCTTEVPVQGMPKGSGKGYVDYVLWGKNSLPLAVVEAKKVSEKASVGSQQAKLYADCLEKKYGQRPLIYTTNGFEIFYTNDVCGYAVREVSGYLTQEELQLEVDRRKLRIPLEHIEISDRITNRPYQKEAVTAVCDAIMKKHRKMLIVQATGSGKTRVSISIVDVLRRHNYVKNILFLADRTALVKQAKNSYSSLLEDLACCNLCEDKDEPENARMIFSTYPTMMHAIDQRKNKDGERLFTPGHFDLIICDEVHRSVYNKYKEIFDYFDAMLLGMTATPKDEIGKNTYTIFDLERRVPTFAYELEQAVAEGYLVNYSTLEYKTKILEEGIRYHDLSEEEKAEFEEKFGVDSENAEDVSSGAINEWFFNDDTIDKVLIELMEKGLKIEDGDKLGKTIIFAKNSNHADRIVERFEKLFPECGGEFIKKIDYSVKFSDTLIDEFSIKDKMPQIAVSVDMLDTGIDIPEILNLVFFKKVRSYAKFWQMIGRGTRLCQNLLGEGCDKERFLIFDFCGNFDFFRVCKNGNESGVQEALSSKIFNLKMEISRALQEPAYAKDEDYRKYRTELVDELHGIVVSFDDRSFLVKRHYRHVEMYRERIRWDRLEALEASDIRNHIAPLVRPQREDELARRFDHLMLSIELGILQSKNVQTAVGTVVNIAERLSWKFGRISQVDEQRLLIERVQTQEFWNGITALDLNHVRENLRGLVHYMDPGGRETIYMNIEDTITEPVEGKPIYDAQDLTDYRKKVEFYLKEHKNILAVYKLRNNKRLTETDLKELEKVLWEELGSRKDYEKEYGDTPIGRLVRRIVGVERSAVNEAFSEFLTEERLSLNQIRFVNLIVDYIVANGNIDDNKVLTEDPFRLVGSITTIFKDDMATARRIMDVVEEIKRNSEVIA